MNNRQQATNWVFTINNPSEEDEVALTDTLPYRYLVYQYEMGDGETMHIQGYVVLSRQLRLSALKKLIPRAHWEVRKGTHEQAKAYSTKSDTRQDGPYEYGSEEGIAKKKGQRSDLLEIKKKIDSGASSAQIWDDHFSSSVRYHKSFDAYRDIKSKHREYKDGEKPKVIILWGPSGTGKSTRARRDFLVPTG